MPVSGLVLSLEPDSQRRDFVLRSLEGDSRITVGVLHEHRLPIVLDTAGAEEDQEVWNQLQQLPGVMFVDVVCVHHHEDITGPDTRRSPLVKDEP